MADIVWGRLCTEADGHHPREPPSPLCQELGVREKRGISLMLLTLLSVVPAAVAVNCGVSGRRPLSMQVEPRPQRYPVWLIWDSRVVMGQVECTSLFLQAFHEGCGQCGVCGKSRVISSADVLGRLCQTSDSNMRHEGNVNGVTRPSNSMETLPGMRDEGNAWICSIIRGKGLGKNPQHGLMDVIQSDVQPRCSHPRPRTSMRGSPQALLGVPDADRCTCRPPSPCNVFP
jgi:hypothetical protein